MIEGIDGSGKTTQARLLKSHLLSEGYDAVLFKEPTDGKWGRKIATLARRGRSVSAQEELSYFMNDRREDVEDNILPALRQRKVVVLDRYYFSSVAYQGARGLDPKEVEASNSAFAPSPDLVIILDIDPKLARERIERYRGEAPNHFETRLAGVRRIFLRLARAHPEARVVEAGRSEAEVHGEIVGLVSLILTKGQRP